MLPDDVGKEFKHIINLQETAAGNLAYKVLKTALIKAYGPKPGDAFQRALSRVMTGKPSSLLKLLISDICKHQHPSPQIIVQRRQSKAIKMRFNWIRNGGISDIVECM